MPEEIFRCPTCGAIQGPVPEGLPKNGQNIRINSVCAGGRGQYCPTIAVSVKRLGDDVLVELPGSNSPILRYNIAEGKWTQGGHPCTVEITD